MDRASSIERPLPVRGSHWASTAWWGMAFLILTEGSLFAYLFFSYFYLASQTHLAVLNTVLGLCGPVLQRGGG